MKTKRLRWKIAFITLLSLGAWACGDAGEETEGGRRANDDDGPMANDDDAWTPPPDEGDDDDGTGISDDDDDAASDDDDDSWTPPPPGDDDDDGGHNPPPPPSTLTAGTIDDHEDWAEFMSFLNQYRSQDVIYTDLNPRLEIRVVSPSGRPQPNARLTVSINQGSPIELKTYSDGVAYLFPDYDLSVHSQSVVNIAALKNGETSFGSSGVYEGLVTITSGDELPAAEMVTLDLLFLVDTTGSMSDEIDKLKETMTSIVYRIDALAREFSIQLHIRLALVRYRDKDDNYRTQLEDFTTSVDQFQEAIDETYAGGGGDYPEDLNHALQEAIRVAHWTLGESDEAARIIFLIADAPPHLDYGQSYNYLSETDLARRMGIRIFPLASSGTNHDAQYIFRQMAAMTGARYLFLTGNSDGGQPGGDPEYTVGRLDSLIVDIVKGELMPFAP